MGRHIICATLFAAILHASLAGVAPTINLNDGNKIPALGLGTGLAVELRRTINWAVEAGYRLIDTAAVYRNEEAVGLGIADVLSRGLVKREELFVTTKLWNDKHARNQVVQALNESLARLRLDYVDLYLIHESESEPAGIDFLETWQGMEDAKGLGLTKSIGVSNFDAAQIKRIIDNSKTRPAVNQIEVHPSFTNEELVTACHNFGVAVMSYTPFGFLVDRGPQDVAPPRIDDPTLTKIAQKYGKTVLQIALRYLIDRGTIPIPKSTHQERLQQNIDVFDFQLTPEEVATINKFNSNKRVIK